jgi:hypothetical protein
VLGFLAFAFIGVIFARTFLGVFPAHVLISGRSRSVKASTYLASGGDNTLPPSLQKMPDNADKLT